MTTSTTTFSAESLTVVSGATTAYLPVSTAWVSVEACSTQIYQAQDAFFIAFDPYYGQNIQTTLRIPCLPPEATSSWQQTNSATTTVLGPTFVCPSAYTSVLNRVVNSFTNQLLCCPSYVKSSPFLRNTPNSQFQD